MILRFPHQLQAFLPVLLRHLLQRIHIDQRLPQHLGDCRIDVSGRSEIQEKLLPALIQIIPAHDEMRGRCGADDDLRLSDCLRAMCKCDAAQARICLMQRFYLGRAAAGQRDPCPAVTQIS